MNSLIQVLYLFTMLGALLGGFQVWEAVQPGVSAPQQAGAAAVGVAMGVLPYCVARSVQEMMRK